MKNIRNILRESLFLNENVKQAEKILSDHNIPLGDKGYQGFKEYLLSKNGIGFLGPITKMVVEDMGQFSHYAAQEMYNQIKNHKQHMHLLPKPFDTYNYSGLMAALWKLPTFVLMNKLSKKLTNPKLQTQLQDWATAFVIQGTEHEERLKDLFNMNSRARRDILRTSDRFDDIYELLGHVAHYKKRFKNGLEYEAIIKKIEESSPKDVEVVFRDDKRRLILLRIHTYKGASHVGHQVWCIARELGEFRAYTRYGDYAQYFLYHFAEGVPEDEQAIAFTLTPERKVTSAMNRNNKGFADIFSHLQSLGINPQELDVPNPSFDEFEIEESINLRKILRENLLLNENVKQAEKILKSFNIPLENPDYIKFKEKLLQRNEIGLLGPLIKMNTYRPLFDIVSIENTYEIIKDNKNILKQLPQPIHAYNDASNLFDDLENTQVRHTLKQFTKKLSNPQVREMVLGLNYDSRNARVEDMEYILNLPSEEQRAFWARSSRYDNLQKLVTGISHFVHQHRKGITYTRTLEKVKKLGNDEVEVVYLDKEKETILLHIKTFGASCAIGTKAWCIAEEKHQWVDYSRNGAQQFFLFSFQETDNSLQMVAFTVNKYGSIIHSHDKNNEEIGDGEGTLRNMGLDWSSIWKSLDLEVDTFGANREIFMSMIGPIEVEQREDNFDERQLHFDFIDTERQIVIGTFDTGLGLDKFLIHPMLYDLAKAKMKTTDEELREVIRFFVHSHLGWASDLAWVIRKMG